ncbi:MAG: hypothetical protein PHE21_01515 [Candidatus Dojkabacteria bacterium]|nr:hypothetical protein [Candidatus Dojkabacteria bacterium]
MKIYSLYTEVNNELKYEYSLQKYGDVVALKTFSNSLAQLIHTHIKGNKNVLYVGVKYPYSNIYKKNFIILTENISKILGLPVVYAYYKYKYDPKNFYDNQKERKVNPPILEEYDKRIYKNWNFIVIEDSIVTGNTINAIDKSLDGVSKSIDVYTILDLSKKNIIEQDLNEYLFKKEGINGLLKISSDKSFIPTTQFLRTYGTLSSSDKELITGNLKKIIEAAYLEYTT